MYPKNRLVILATFAHAYQAKDTLYSMSESGIHPEWAQIFSKESIKYKTKGLFLESETLIIELQGIKDIILLESLFIESICRENNVLTCDIITAKKNCESLLQQVQEVV